jgi:hypothetical protein
MLSHTIAIEITPEDIEAARRALDEQINIFPANPALFAIERALGSTWRPVSLNMLSETELPRRIALLPVESREHLLEFQKSGKFTPCTIEVTFSQT